MEIFSAKRQAPGDLDGQCAGADRRHPCDVQPIPVEVPKRSISRELAQGL